MQVTSQEAARPWLGVSPRTALQAAQDQVQNSAHPSQQLDQAR